MVNVMQRCWTSTYNVWQDVCLTQTTENNNELAGEYVVHNFNSQNKKDFKQGCRWTYDDLYIIKEIYGGFLEFLKN